MKKLLFLLLLFSLKASSQYISGLYTGTLVNDSTKKIQNYELALSEYRGKITGYSYTTFVVNDTFYYSIKRIKASRENGALIVEDEKMLANNFPESPAKRVRQTNIIQLTSEDTLSAFNGKWNTNQTKIYYSLHGQMDMRRENDSSASALITHLKELNIITDEKDKKIAQNKTKPPAVSPAISIPQPAEVKVKVKEDKTKIKVQKAEPAATTAKTEIQKHVPVFPAQRQTNVLKEISVVNDSLVLSFYDNGVVDGDMISVSVNGEMIISNTKLTEAAVKKTVYLNSINAETIALTLIAENLGSIPPNTGLLIIHDGETKHEIRFSADMQTNASIVLRKKK